MMEITRPTFVVQVRREEQLVVVENVRTGERVHLPRVGQVGHAISGWLAESGDEREALDEQRPPGPAD
jgi:hypothetical protein